MFRRNGVISRSFHTPHGVNVNGVSVQQGRVKRKLSWSSGRIRTAYSEGVLSRRPVVLKEGFLCKPTFFRFGGRKRRWCVLRTYTQSEASVDIYLDETKTRYKGSISLDKDANPLLIVKNVDGRRKSARQCYLSLKVGKNTYPFTTDSFRELREWCSLIRQAMDCGSLFSGRLIEPTNIEEGMVNVKFNSNCIAILCPIKEVPLKTWRLDHITSFGQCGGILTFECCCNCSDPNASRCSINIVQEKPATILNIMERAIRNNPNTSEIHYERSILGDIYHCNHECGLGRLPPAHSDPNIFRSCSASPLKGFTVPIDLHSSLNLSRAPSNTLESNDSGLPGTPQAEESLSIASSIPSPTGSNMSNPSFKQKERGSPFRSPKHSSQQTSQLHYKGRSMSDSRPSPNARDALQSYANRQSDDPTFTPRYATPTVHRQVNEQSPQHHHPRLTYAKISHDASPKLVKKGDAKQSSSADSSVTYATVKNGSSSESGDVTPQPRERKSTYNRLQPVNEDQEGAVYDIPNCEFSNPFSPQSSPAHRSRRISEPNRSPRRSAQSVITPYRPGSDRRDRAEDYDEAPPVPRHRRPLKEVPPPVSQLHRKNGMQIDGPFPRRRLQSSSDVLESARPMSTMPARSRGSVDDLLQTSRNRSNSVTSAAFPHNRQLRGSSDLLAKLHEEEEKLTKVLDQSRRERNDELSEAKDRLGELNRPFHFNIDDLDYDEPDPDMILETCSNLVDYRSHIYSAPSHVDKVLTKVANNSVRGYAYKITIPVANTQYDVPRRAAAAADLSYVRSDAPPKPIRCSSIENLYFMN